MFSFSKKDFTVGGVVEIESSCNICCLFGKDYNGENLYKVTEVGTDRIFLGNNKVCVFFTDVKRVKIPHDEPWVSSGDTVTLKSTTDLRKCPIVIGLMMHLAGQTTTVNEIKNVTFNTKTGRYVQEFNLNFPDDGGWHWQNNCLAQHSFNYKYNNYADLVKFTSESVRVVRCKNCRYWHSEITSGISSAMCLCELNSPKFPKTDYGYFTKADSFCPDGAPDPNRDYGYGKLSEINPKYTED